MVSSSSWTEVVSRQTRSTFHPSNAYCPHVRSRSLTGNGYVSADTFNTNRYDALEPGFTFPTQNLGRGRGRGGGRRGRGGGYQNRDPVSEPNPFGISDKLDELNVTENTTGGEGIDFSSYEDTPVQSTGENIPSPVNTFAEIDLGRALNENISRCKFVKPTPIQRHAIPIVAAGRDLMACAQTGSGKTAAFCFPIISEISKIREFMAPASMLMSGRGGRRAASPIALILSPTRELSSQIHDEAKKFAHQTGVKIAVVYGGAPVYEQLRNMERGVDILVATPGRLVDIIDRGRVSLGKIKYLALDEADRMLDMGFEPQIRKIIERFDMPQKGPRQTMLFSATFPDEIQRLASDLLSNYIFLSVGRVGSSTDRISQRVEFVQDYDKKTRLINILRELKEKGLHGKLDLVLVFVETKRGADSLEHYLFTNGFRATAIHGDKVQMERERALKSFKTGATPIMVATDVAARGLDISNVSHVINFDLPKSIDDYVHRIGRTGRAGKSGIATAFFNESNSNLANPLIELMQEAKQEVPDWLIEHANNSASYCSGRRAKGGKFGGHDYRNADYNSVVGPNDNYYVDGNGGCDGVSYGGAADFGGGGGFDTSSSWE